jgi:hypothetical protein
MARFAAFSCHSVAAEYHSRHIGWARFTRFQTINHGIFSRRLTVFTKSKLIRLAVGALLALPLGYGMLQPSEANAWEIIRRGPIVRVGPIVRTEPIIRVGGPVVTTPVVTAPVVTTPIVTAPIVRVGEPVVRVGEPIVRVGGPIVRWYGWRR